MPLDPKNNHIGERYKAATIADLTKPQVEYCLQAARANAELARARHAFSQWQAEIHQLEILLMLHNEAKG